MDYTLAALKLLCIQLKAARPTHDSSQSSISYGPILFQRAWLQGVIISLPSTAEGDGRFLVDDGTGVVELVASRDFINRDWKLGHCAYVMVVGGCVIRDDDLPLIKGCSRSDSAGYDDCFGHCNYGFGKIQTEPPVFTV
ncbi:putative recQ-mediated genome instability protein [Helianthus annuus]|nr:putative recQ-mediated genome instability protein [Helianthus annuus]KAJ0690698.1 putative recQ-mediated genome instability protein [Helianthus annuus]